MANLAHAARLPSVGSDSNAWGNLLNEYLRVSHTENGTLIKGLNASFDNLNISQALIVLGSIYAEIPDSFKNSNWTALYNNEASTRFGLENFTTAYESRAYWKLSNFTSAYSAEYSNSGYKSANFTSDYNARTDRFGTGNFTAALNNYLSAFFNKANYSAEYSSSGYKKANLTIDYPNLDTDSANDITTSDTATVTNTMLAGSIALSKLASGSSTQIIVAGSSGVPAYVALSGDATISNSGVLTIANDAVTTLKIANDAVTASKIAANAVDASEIRSNAVSSDEIEDNSITTTDLSANLTFSGIDLVDLGSVDHSDTTIRGLRIPVSSGTPATLTGTPEGFIAWDSVNNVLYLSADGGWATFFQQYSQPKHLD